MVQKQILLRYLWIKPSVDDIGARDLAREILRDRPQIGCLTISNALQWRLQYTRAIEWAGNYDGVHAIYRAAFLRVKRKLSLVISKRR